VGVGWATPPSLCHRIFQLIVDISFKDDVTVILLLCVSFLYKTGWSAKFFAFYINTITKKSEKSAP
jgi:hypothetical protein